MLSSLPYGGPPTILLLKTRRRRGPQGIRVDKNGDYRKPANKRKSVGVLFDFSWIVHGFLVIICEEQFVRDLFGSCDAKISDSWEGIKLKTLPNDEIQKRPFVCIDRDKLNQSLRRQTSRTLMED